MILPAVLRRGAAALALCAASGALAQAIVPPPTPNADALAAQVRILSANPRDVNALVMAGELSARLADTDAAMAFFARAASIDPRNPRIAAGRANTLVVMERPGEALRQYEQAERAGLAMTPYLGQRGLAYDLTGQPGYAQRDYRRALQAGPDDETTRRLALSLGMSGKRDEAMALLDPLLRRSDRAAWRARAFVMALSGDMAGADRIAATTMPGGAAFGPFFRRLPALSPADRAFAVHFGEVGTTAARIADARLAPAVAVLPAEPVAVAAASPAPAPVARGRRQTRGQTSLGGARVARRDPPVAGVPSGASNPSSGGTRVSVPVQVAAARAVPTPPSTQAPASRASRAVSTTVVPPASAPTVALTGSPSPARSVMPAAAAAVASAVPLRATAKPQTAPPTVVRSPITPSAPTAVTAVPTSAASAPPAPPGSASAGPTPVAQTAAVPRAAMPYQVIDAPGRVARPAVPAVAVSPAPAVRRRGNEALLASIISSIEVPSSELAARPAPPARRPEVTPVVAKRTVDAKIAPPRAKPVPPVETAEAKPVMSKAETKVPARADARSTAADKSKVADKSKAAEKNKSADKKPAATKPDTARWWVQVAGGARATDLNKDWKRLTDKSTALKGKNAFVTPLRATNRLLTGPFKTEAEARGVVNALSREDKSAFIFQSDAGQKVDRLDKE